MGIQAIGKLISYANKTQACKNLSFVKNATAAKVLERELKFAPELIGDTCHFSKVDRSLDPEFLKGLLKIEGTKFEKIIQIKDKILQAMGYDAKLVKVVERPKLSDLGLIAGFNYSSGELAITDSLNRLPDGFLVCTIRHECEHMSQGAKIYKTKGFKAYQEALNIRCKKTGALVEDVNTSFWDKFSQKADISDKDIEKYYEALVDIPASSKDSFYQACRYFENALEVGAYDVEEKIAEILYNGKYITARQRWPRNAEAIGMLLTEKGCLPEEKAQMLNTMTAFIMQRKGLDANILPDAKTLQKIYADVEKELKTGDNNIFEALLRSTRLLNSCTYTKVV